MRSYDPVVAGHDEPVDSWVYCLRASAFLDDPFGALRLKRRLERGQLEPDPTDRRITGRVGLATAEQWAAAIDAAAEARRAWAATPLADRIEFAHGAHEEVQRHSSDLIDVLIGEGHPRRLAEWEVGGMLQSSSPVSVRWIADQLYHEHTVGQRTVRIVRKPDGVVCLSPPQNAATAVSFLGVGALVAGNTLVVKAPSSCPLGVAFVYRNIVLPLLERFGAPPGTVSVLCGPGGPVMRQWLDSPLVNDIFFVGSSERGLALGAECFRRGKKPILELAGNDGVIVWRDADIALAARALTECFYGSTQICMVPKYVLAHPDIADELIACLVSKLDAIRPGNPEDVETLLSPVLRTTEFFEVMAEATAAGARVVTGGQRMDQNGEVSTSGIFLQPTVLRIDGLEAGRGSRAVRQETFYPLLPIVVPDPAEVSVSAALEFINANAYGLRNSLWTADESLIQRFCAEVDNGGLLKINDSHIGFVPLLPTHGGTGLSGGPFGGANFPILTTTHLQGISIATGVEPRTAVFESAMLPNSAAHSGNDSALSVRH